MQVTLTPHGRELPEAARGAGISPEDVVERALETLMVHHPRPSEPTRTPAEAVAHIREARRGVTLGGVIIRDLINEGRKL